MPCRRILAVLLLAPLLLSMSAANPPIPQSQAAVEASLTVAERQLLQEGLVIATGRDLAIDGVFGPASRDAIEQFQQLYYEPPTGVLTAAQAVRLMTLRDIFEQQYSWRQIDDPVTGSSIAIPLSAMGAEEGDDPSTSLWDGARPALRLQLTTRAGSREDFEAAYRQGADEAMLTSVLRRGDRFTLAGRRDETDFYRMAEWRDGVIREFTLSWDASIRHPAALFARRMSWSFSPFDPPSQRDGEDRNLIALAHSAPPDALPLSGQYLDGTTSGVIASKWGDIVSDGRPLETCAALLVDGQPARRVAEDPATGLALVRPVRRTDAVAILRGGLAFPSESLPISNIVPPEGLPSSMAGYTLGQPDAPVALVPGRLLYTTDGAFHISPSVGAGASGGPVIDASGYVTAVVWGEEDVIAAAWRSGETPDDLSDAIDVGRVRRFLSANGVVAHVAGTEAPLTAAEIAAVAADITVRVECWR